MNIIQAMIKRKFILLFSMGALFSNSTFSQSIQNGSFENWTFDNTFNEEVPDNWVSSIYGVDKFSSLTDGSYSVMLSTEVLSLPGFTDTINGFVVYGGENGEFVAFSGAPSEFLFDYYFDAVSLDTAYAFLQFKNGSTVLLDTTIEVVASVPTPGSLSLPLNLPMMADSVRIGFSSGSEMLSYFTVDNVRFNDAVSVDLVSGNQFLRVYPNPVDDVLFLEANLNTEAYLTDAQGRTVKRFPVSQYTAVDVSALSGGVYFLFIHGENRRRTVLINSNGR